MQVVEATMSRPATGGRVVWGGRWGQRVAGALDGWTCDRTSLLARLDDAAELVVLDALSFPWETLRPRDRDIPLVVVLPDVCSLDTIDLVLGHVVLGDLTPLDLVVEGRAEVRAGLQERHGLADEHFLDPGTSDRDGVVAALAARSLDQLDEVETALGTFRSQADDLITRQLREFGAHQRGVLNMLLALVEPDDLVIDVGAHIGTLTIPLARRLEDGHVLAVEGHPATAAVLRHNVAANGLADRIRVRNAIVGPGGSDVVHPHLATGNTGATSFRPTVRSVGDAQPTVRLDDLWAAEDLPLPTILKVDVEGAELQVLGGADDLVAARPILLLEVAQAQLATHGDSIEALQVWLDERDYTLLVSAGTRNHEGATWELEPLARLADHHDGLFDVVAVPPGSSRVADLGLRGSA